MTELVERLGITIVAFDREHAREAKLAYALYGKGQDHPARLDFGDCITYALAKRTGQPLIFQGDDFTHTDLALVPIGGA